MGPSHHGDHRSWGPPIMGPSHYGDHPSWGPPIMGTTDHRSHRSWALPLWGSPIMGPPIMGTTDHRSHRSWGPPTMGITDHGDHRSWGPPTMGITDRGALPLWGPPIMGITDHGDHPRWGPPTMGPPIMGITDHGDHPRWGPPRNLSFESACWARRDLVCGCRQRWRAERRGRCGSLVQRGAAGGRAGTSLPIWSWFSSGRPAAELGLACRFGVSLAGAAGGGDEDLDRRLGVSLARCGGRRSWGLRYPGPIGAFR
jgi:hypothetical protein